MTLVSCCRRIILRSRGFSAPKSLALTCRNASFRSTVQKRSFTKTPHWGDLIDEKADSDANGTFWDEYRRSFSLPAPTLDIDIPCPAETIGQRVTVTGFLRNRRQLNAGLGFATIGRGSLAGSGIQIMLKQKPGETQVGETFKRLRENSAVSVTGYLQPKVKKPNKAEKHGSDAPSGFIPITDLEIHVEDLKIVNSFPNDIVVGKTQKFGPESRHLEIRFDSGLFERLQFRSRLAQMVRKELNGFSEIETPILFKSTPEGAREFLVPTRRPGYAYALPQSPQQYKQILMASGVSKYFQFAKCFRDEDLRADRQPEFTQIDLEMAWTDGQGVMQTVESLVKSIHSQLAETPFSSTIANDIFPRLTYEEAMSKHGSDKPDLRILDLIHRVEHVLPDNLKGMLTSIENPIIEACKFRLDGDSKNVQKFIHQFMDSADAEQFQQNPDGPPGIFVFDLQKPLEGLQAFGFEGAESLKSLYASLPASPYGLLDPRGAEVTTTFDEGDLLLLQARPNTRHSGGSTMLGKLRLAVYKEAISAGLLASNPSLHYLWITDFPLFTSNIANPNDPGQGGASGFSSTHHPFTAPKTAEDVDLLLTDPLAVTADHYDLVVNGVELGGGSKRIHSSEMQQYIMRNVLKMSEDRMKEFDHLFEALRAGCPPHAGLAIGFDRWVAVLTGRESVRDVIYFPKGKRGEDLLVRSPGVVTDEQREVYGLSAREKKEEVKE
ncbi:aspartate--tRNA ligase msd1 [Clarireedia jacksonii]